MWLTTFNVNGVRARETRLENWIDQYYPSVLCLQETKCPDKLFPRKTFEKFYPHIIHTDQTKANGVAILSKYKMYDVETNPFETEQHRVIAATINGIRVINIYLPQGQSLESEKFVYKQWWLKQFYVWLEDQFQKYDDVVILGDYNICPTDKDVWSTKYWHSGIVSCTPLERKFYASLLKDFDLTDSIRSLTDNTVFTWWGYIGWHYNPLKQGVRIDHVLHSSKLKAVKYHIDTEERCNAKGASDHTAVSVRIK